MQTFFRIRKLAYFQVLQQAFYAKRLLFHQTRLGKMKIFCIATADKISRPTAKEFNTSPSSAKGVCSLQADAPNQPLLRSFEAKFNFHAPPGVVLFVQRRSSPFSYIEITYPLEGKHTPLMSSWKLSTQGIVRVTFIAWLF
jgi:hypothetical protein